MKYIYKTYVIDYEVNAPKTNNSYILFLHGWKGNKNSFSVAESLLCQNAGIIKISFPPNNTGAVVLDMFDYAAIAYNIVRLINVEKVGVLCHSFGFRIAMLLSQKYDLVDKLFVTAGAGIKLKRNIFKKFIIAHSQIILKTSKNKKVQDLHYNFIASKDYLQLNALDKETFKNVVNFDLTYCIKTFKFPIVLFWGKNDADTPVKIAKIIKKHCPDAKLLIYKNLGHFAYLENVYQFKHECNAFFNG